MHLTISKQRHGRGLKHKVDIGNPPMLLMQLLKNTFVNKRKIYEYGKIRQDLGTTF